MADYLTTDTDLTSVANAIRVKAEISGSLEFPSEFISAINAISTGGMTVTRTPDAAGGDVLTITGTATEIEPLSVTTNGTYTAPSGKAYSPVTVNVPSGSSGTKYYGSYGAATTVSINGNQSQNSLIYLDAYVSDVGSTLRFWPMNDCTVGYNTSARWTFVYSTDIPEVLRITATGSGVYNTQTITSLEIDSCVMFDISVGDWDSTEYQVDTWTLTVDDGAQ